MQKVSRPGQQFSQFPIFPIKSLSTIIKIPSPSFAT